MNDEAVCRTAPATPGLSNTLHHVSSSIYLAYYLLQLKGMCSNGSLKLLTFILPGAFAKEGFEKGKKVGLFDFLE